MIFTVILLYPVLLLESLVHCAALDGSQSPATYLSSSSGSSSSTSSRNLSTLSAGNNSPGATTNSGNGPLENAAPAAPSASRGKRGSAPRQVSTSEWIFSSLVQPDAELSSPTRQLNARGNSAAAAAGLTYRSIAPFVASSNYYTHYYRNHNIYAHSASSGRGDGGGEDDKPLARAKYDGSLPDHQLLPEGQDQGKSVLQQQQQQQQPRPNSVPDIPVSGRRRALGLASPSINDVNRIASASATSKAPEAAAAPRTTGLSRTAPATDPTLLITERPTSTQEMQISGDDELQLEGRTEIGRKRGREMMTGTSAADGAAETLYFEDSAPIVFPGNKVTAGGSTTKYAVRPFDSRVLNAWKRIHDMKENSMSGGVVVSEGRKSPVSSDTSSNAKVVSLLTIHGTPKCATKSGYCDDIESYPKSFFNQVLNNKTLSPVIFKDVFGETTDNSSFSDDDIKLRHDFEDSPLCSVREHTIYPKAAQNRKGKYMYIVNHDEYLQGIRVETCTKENGQCEFTEGAHPPGYSSVCKQKFIYKKLLAFTPEGKAMPDTFRLPSCCVCHVRSRYIADRINPAEPPNSDIQPTAAADDNTWVPSSTLYPFGVTTHETTTMSTTTTTVREDVSSGITFPTTSKDDLSSTSTSYQVPSPTSSTTSSGSLTPSTTQHSLGQHNYSNRAENQTARRLH